MNRINVFFEHVLEACSQQGSSEEDILGKIRCAGIEGLECDLWRLRDRKSTKALFDSCEMQVSSVYSTFDFGHEDRNVSVRKIHELLETAAYFGADKVLAVLGFVNSGDDAGAVCGKICEVLNEMCRIAEDYGITVMLEDFDDCKAPYSTAEGLEYFMKNTDGLRLAFDTGNFAYCLESAEEAYERLKQYIIHVHLKDRSYDKGRADKDNTNGKADMAGKIMYPCEVGGGFIGIEELIGSLLSDNYKGSFSIEHFGAVNQLEYMLRSAETVRELLKV